MIEKLGDRAVRLARPAVSARALVRAIRAWPGVVDVVVAREAIGVYFDGAPQIEPARVAELGTLSDVAEPVREHVLRAVYDGEDLPALPRETVELHSSAVYTVDTMGFMPGFAYLVGLPPALAAVPRLATPRTRVPQNAIGIAGGFTGVYPFATSGGWHLIGRVVDARMFDEGGPLLAVGDRVRFEPCARAAAPVSPRGPVSAAEPDGAALVIERITGLVTVQDLGRRGHLHESIPPGGALVRSQLVAANRLAGTADGAPALEIFGRVTVRAESDIVLATDRAITLRAGDTLDVISEPARVAYLALRGGIDVAPLFGAHGALVSCGLGPILSPGSRIRPNVFSFRTFEVSKGENVPIQVRVIAGPDLDAVGTLSPLESAPYRVLSASDRVGTRLAGPKMGWVAGYRTRSRPMVRGAIELPPDGQPIVLGPEHPTVGGHPIIGVIADDDQDRFFATRVGGDVRFVVDQKL